MRYIYLLIIFSVIFTESIAQQKLPKLKEGDLVFQDLDCGPLCDAIEAVTEGYQGRDFSHVALIVRIGDEYRAVEAIGSHVKSTSIDSLFLRCPNPNKYLVMRLHKEYKHLIPAASRYAISTIGKAYDDRFIMNNDSLYCSELVFNAYHIFDLQPMTYKDPKTADYFPAWVDYYKSLNSFIPEGLMGINPGLISRSPYLYEVKAE